MDDAPRPRGGPPRGHGSACRRRGRDVDAPIIDRIVTIEHEIVAPQAAGAEMVVDRDFVIRTHR